MKTTRNSTLIVMSVTAFNLLAAGFAAWIQTGFGGMWRLAAFICCGFGVIGVVWLGWYWRKLSGAITSIAESLRDGRQSCGRSTGNLVADELNQAINKCLVESSEYISRLENQIHELKIKNQLSEKQKANTEAIIHSIRDAVIVVDEYDKLLVANETAGKLFGFDYKESIHKPIGELVAKDRADFANLLRHSRESKTQVARREIEIAGACEIKIFDCIISCVYDSDENVCSVVAVLHDITREKEISQMKNDFVDAVCHDLKAPLASISAYSEMLVDGEAQDNETRKEFYSVIQSQAARLNRMIEDMLNTSRIESGLIKVDKQPVSLTILIKEQMQMIQSYAEEKNISVTGQKPIVFDQVNADKDMISRVIINLLSNAVKYTPEGGSVKIETEVDDIASVARVTVTDTGIGIPEEAIEHVFDKFYRVKANNSMAKGTGLGLNLVKQIIEKVHNGKVFVKSEVGVGSTFGFELPLVGAEITSNNA